MQSLEGYIQIYSPLKKLKEVEENNHYLKNPLMRGRNHTMHKTTEAKEVPSETNKSRSYQGNLENTGNYNCVLSKGKSVHADHFLISAKSYQEETKICSTIQKDEKEQLLLQPNIYPKKTFTHANTVQLSSHTDAIRLLARLSDQTVSQLSIISALHPLKFNIANLLDFKRPIKTTDKTIVFDLDDTLIHSFSLLVQENRPFHTPNTRYISLKNVNITFEVRPHLYEMLTTLSNHYELIIFTASQKSYADRILDMIDPSNKWFNHRLYRNDCAANECVLVKDLRVLKRDLKKVVMVDNCMLSFSSQIDNGIPVSSYKGGSMDTELSSLMEYLMKIKDVEDVRVANRKEFKLSEMIEYCRSFKPECKL